MRRVVPDLDEVVDPSAEPVDWDQALAKFLLTFVRKQATSTVDAAAAVAVDLTAPPQTKGSSHATG